MKTFSDPAARQELLARLEKITPDTQPLWGKMSAAQMLAHLTQALRTPTGEVVLQPMPLIARLIGCLIKARVLGEKPYGKNSPTAKEYHIKDSCDFAVEKANFLDAFHKLAAASHSLKTSNHAFFGTFTPENWLRHAYKHTDHHFQQFGA